MWCRTSGTERIYWQQSKTTKNQCSVTLNDSTNVEALMQIILREGPSEREKRVYLISTDIWTKVSEGDRLNCTDSSKTRKDIPIDLSFELRSNEIYPKPMQYCSQRSNKSWCTYAENVKRKAVWKGEWGSAKCKSWPSANQSHYKWTQNKSPWSWQSKTALINSRTIKKEISKIKQKLPKQSLQFHKKMNHQITKFQSKKLRARYRQKGIPRRRYRYYPGKGLTTEG